MIDALDTAKLGAQTAYNAAADYFDDDPLGFRVRIGRRTVERLGLKAGGLVLDVGCGTGASALPAAEQVGSSGRVIAVDLADRLLAIGRAKAQAQGLDNIEFQMRDMEKLGYPDKLFDGVISVFSIFFVQDMHKQLGELWRMVRPGGKLAITTWGPKHFEPAYSNWMEAVQIERPDLYSPASAAEDPTTPEAMRALLHDSGITEAEVVAEDGHQPLRSPEDWWTVVLGSGMRGTIEQMEAEAAARVRRYNLKWIRENRITSINTPVVYATATKR